jgi:hypothetical protein
MGLLLTLDGTLLDESQTLAKSKRKSVVNSTNCNLDKAEELVSRIEELQSKAS